MKDTFNPQDWLPSNEDEEPKPSNNPPTHSGFSTPEWVRGTGDDIELVVSRIESAHTDITGSYGDWLNLGFALSDELGERGRDYFHRLSRFYSKYSHTDCNKQFDQCLKAKGHGITIKTLFHMAKQAGIEIVIGSVGHGARGVGHGAESVGQKTGSKEPGASEPQAPSTEPQAYLPQAPSTEPSGLPSPVSGLPSPDSGLPDLPTLPSSVYDALPDFLQKVVDRCHTNEERDVMLLGALATISSCLQKVFGFYDETRVYANIFLFVTAQASAGKGRLMLCKRLVNPIHWALRKQTQAMKAQYEIEIREYNLQKAKGFNTMEKPTKPAEKMLFIPANNSTTGVFQLLSDNEGKGLIFETEGDTLAQAFKSDYGNYSDGFRKAFHHETISYYRRTDREYVEIDNPCVSTVLSSTPKQVAILIPNAENGLLSRFVFYRMNIRPVWKNVFPPRKNKDLDVYFDNLGQEFFPLYKALGENPAIEFSLTQEQQDEFHAFFTQVQDKYLMLQGMDYMATIRRLGLIAFRLAMIFTTLRILETGDFSEKQVCSDTDFQAVLSMVKVLVRHSSHVFSELPEEVKPTKPKDKKEKFLDMLPKKFNRQIYLDLAKSLSIPARTAEKYISTFSDKGLIFREQQGFYTNLSISDEDILNEGTEGEKQEEP